MGVRDGYTASEQDIHAAMDAHDINFDQLAAMIDRHPDPQRALDLANELAERDSKRKSAIADLRARQVRRIWEAEEMSLTELGARIGGLSKVRARRMVQDAGGTTNRPRGTEQETDHGDASPR